MERPLRDNIVYQTRRYGVKLFTLCSTDGYSWWLSVYAGKSELGERETGLEKNVCMELSELLLNEGRNLYIDNFDTSYELAQCLLEEERHTLGSLRANKRGVPIDVLEAKLKREVILEKIERALRC